MIEFELKMQTSETCEEELYKLRDDIIIQKRAYNALKNMCFNEGQLTVVDMIDVEMPRFEALTRAIASTPIITPKDIHRWRKELTSIFNRLLKIYKVHKDYQVEEEAI